MGKAKQKDIFSVLGHGLLDTRKCRALLACNERLAEAPLCNVHQVVFAPIAEHSKKPDIIREKIVELAGDLPRIELFARQSPTGWDIWGNEVDCSIQFP